MTTAIILASGSTIRATLLQNAGVLFDQQVPRIDEQTVKETFQANGSAPSDIADALAAAKAKEVARSYPDAMVIGCDQVLAFNGTIMSKPRDPDNAKQQLIALRGRKHSLFSAAVVYDQGQPIWRYTGAVMLQMRDFSDAYLESYLARSWQDIQHCIGGYQLEAEGVRLFETIEGDYFHVLGMPLLELLAFLTLRGAIEG
ncbi:MAG: Maf family nucleotide pyrophosphatase [Pseudomonadota bacterium]